MEGSRDKEAHQKAGLVDSGGKDGTDSRKGPKAWNHNLCKDLSSSTLMELPK